MKISLFFLLIYYILFIGDNMVSNKGFTLVEIISVIALLALVAIITIPVVGNVRESAKKKTLQTKIDNIEKAAVLYGQNHRENFTESCTGVGELCEWLNPQQCKCYKEEIRVQTLIDNKKINADDESGNIFNSVNESEPLNDCKIQIYQKYGKIYAVYDRETNKDKCWYQD